MALKGNSPKFEDCKKKNSLTSHLDDSGDPDSATEHTPLLAGPSYKPSCFIPGPVSSCSGVSPTTTDVLLSSEPLDSRQSLERSNAERDAYRRRSSSQGRRDNQANSISSSTTVHNPNEICAGFSDALPGSAPSQSLLFPLPRGISLRLENSGSVARDHLASERTFLAYIRTSLAIASSGVGKLSCQVIQQVEPVVFYLFTRYSFLGFYTALVQLFSAASASIPKGSTHRLHHYIRPLGASTVLIGLLVLFIGAWPGYKLLLCYPMLTPLFQG